MAKDLSLAIAAAHSVKAPLPLGAGAHQLYNLLSSHGKGHLDFSVVFDFLQKQKK
jgi:3-hydroxyisobutyrate dehydrogenase